MIQNAAIMCKAHIKESSTKPEWRFNVFYGVAVMGGKVKMICSSVRSLVVGKCLNLKEMCRVGAYELNVCLIIFIECDCNTEVNCK